MIEITEYNENIFENIKHINEYDQEFWYSRELAKVLGYNDYRNFENAIYKAMEACENSSNLVDDHFESSDEPVKIGSGAVRYLPGYKLSRYACYLAVQNGDPEKREIALGQTYFAVKTRQQELIENYDSLTEDEKRISIRQEIREHNKSLAEAANNAGITDPYDYAIFQNKGYQGLYGGLNRKDIHKRKGLKKSQDILDHMGSEELAANLFRATQTDAKLRRENIQGKEHANETHYNVGKAVRETIASLGGTMPEDLPTPEKSIKSLERQAKKKLDK